MFNYCLQGSQMAYETKNIHDTFQICGKHIECDQRLSIMSKCDTQSSALV